MHAPKYSQTRNVQKPSTACLNDCIPTFQFCYCGREKFHWCENTLLLNRDHSWKHTFYHCIIMLEKPYEFQANVLNVTRKSFTCCTICCWYESVPHFHCIRCGWMPWEPWGMWGQRDVCQHYRFLPMSHTWRHHLTQLPTWIYFQQHSESVHGSVLANDIESSGLRVYL